MPTKKSSSRPRRRSTANRSSEGLGERILAALDAAPSTKSIKVSRLAVSLGCARGTIQYWFAAKRPTMWKLYQNHWKEMRA